MMSAVVAAESCGLGTNCIGYLRTVDPARVAELLHLPKGVLSWCADSHSVYHASIPT